MSDVVLVAFINGTSNILAVAIPSIVVAIAGFSFRKYRRMKRKYLTALQDMQFLLAVEHEHCKMHKEHSGASNRTTVRATVACDHSWSGEFSASRIRNELRIMEQG